MVAAVQGPFWCLRVPEGLDRPEIIVPTASGCFLGFVATLGDDDHGVLRLPALRTWLHDGELCDDQADAVRALRRIEPQSEQAAQ